MQGEKTGGRVKGTPNKATKQVKDFLDQVFTEAFKDPQFKNRLVKALVTLELDPKVLTTLLAYYAGKPAQQIEHTHSGADGDPIQHEVKVVRFGGRHKADGSVTNGKEME